MSAQQIRQWAGEGVEFGTHGRRHRDLCTLSQRELDEELEGSQIDLKNLLDRPAIALAYPWGRFNQTVLNRTKRAYQAAFGHNPGVNCLGTDSYGLRRVPCSGRPLFALASWLKLGCGPFLLA
jgi:peptidoglycan/xylan/chitin deacetylase (PgdA/CDA1 family)